MLQEAGREYYTSPLTIHVLYYFGQKEGLEHHKLLEISDLCRLVKMNGLSVRLAQERYKNKDFEDCLQAACAEIAGCDEILTLDKNFAKHSGTKLKVRVV